MIITFETTDNMKAVGIESFSLNRRDYQLFLSGGRRCCVDCSPKVSMAHHVKGIERRLLQELGDGETKDKLIESAMQDIENMLVERRDEIYGMASSDGRSCSDSGNTSINPDDDAKLKYIDKVKEQRIKFKESGVTYEQWQSKVAEKYENLHNVVVKYYPDAWTFLEFCLAVKSILNIEGFTLPFMGVILAVPASMKTMVIELFRKYPVSGGGLFPISNGQTTGMITVAPPSPGSFSCPGGQTLVLASVTYTNVMICDQLGNCVPLAPQAFRNPSAP